MSRAPYLPSLLCLLLLALGSVSVCGCAATERQQIRVQSAVSSAEIESGAPGFESDVEAVTAFLKRRHARLADAEIARLAPVIVAEARRSGFSLELVLAVIHVESSGNIFAKSKVGALGLMQLLPATGQETARDIGIPWEGTGTLFDPADNVRLGVAYLERMVDRFGDLPTALAAYNWGPGRISGFLRRGEGVPTAYANRVLRTAERGA